MEAVAERSNLWLAYRRVVENRGAPGIDGLSVEQFKDWLKTHWPGVKAASLNLSAIWAGFAHTGVARAPGVADWPRYTPRTRATMLVDEKCVLADDPDAAAREMWLKIDPRWG